MKEEVSKLAKALKQRFVAHPWHGITIGENQPNMINAFIEIIPSDTIKYEVDKDSGYIMVDRPRSEEHTSELQSRPHLVCRLLLEKKKPNQAPAVLVDPQKTLKECRHWWRSWVSQTRYKGRWRDAVVRSLITLKALTYLPTCSIVSAPTTSLPEAPGRSANWDYRFCWIRDAVWALDILIDSNYLGEVHAWRE